MAEVISNNTVLGKRSSPCELTRKQAAKRARVTDAESSDGWSPRSDSDDNGYDSWDESDSDDDDDGDDGDSKTVLPSAYIVKFNAPEQLALDACRLLKLQMATIFSANNRHRPQPTGSNVVLPDHPGLGLGHGLGQSHGLGQAYGLMIGTSSSTSTTTTLPSTPQTTHDADETFTKLWDTHVPSALDRESPLPELTVDDGEASQFLDSL